jgi:hypothetical protein
MTTMRAGDTMRATCSVPECSEESIITKHTSIPNENGENEEVCLCSEHENLDPDEVVLAVLEHRLKVYQNVLAFLE